LINDYTISYAYSISQWLNDKQRSIPDIRASHSCLAIAPTFDQNDKTLAPLEHNLSEAQAVLTQFPGMLLADSMASRQQFLAHAGDYAILHLATHALANMRDGDYAYLVLASDSIDPTTLHSKLYVKDLYAQHWKAQLAVLSACETGIGNFRSGEGVISLGRGFAQAGVRSTVSSLWQINDTQTALLMEQFYHFLQQGYRKDDALQSAKTTLLKQSSHDLAHPFYWASYLPYGDMAPLQIGQNSLVWWWLGGLLLLASAYYFFRPKR
jgi:CHAT domain-containing protein